jgi:hypothetical protein
MSEVAQGTQQEFWRPPAHELEAAPGHFSSGLADACSGCGTEFLLGSHFCHSCGSRRPEALDASARADAAEMAGQWQQAVHGLGSMLSAISLQVRRIPFPSWLHYLHFHEIKSRLGLSLAPMIAFLIGLGCVAGALLVGLLTAKTLVDWQAIQFYRAEWLLAATAAFVAGILLKNRSDDSE